MSRKARLLARGRKLFRDLRQRQPGSIGSVVPQEKLHRFPQRGIAELYHRLRVLLNRHMQRVTRGQHLPCSHETFELRRSQGIDRRCIMRQPAKDLIGDALRLCLVFEVFLNAPTRRIKCELVHRLSTIDRLIEFDCLLTVRNNCRHILYGGVSTKLHLLCIPLCKNQSLT
jgi:hypothetical protein